MSTLIAAYNSDGFIGRCDAKCHNAKKPKCHCICNGVNHGAGHNQAVKNTAGILLDHLEKNLPIEVGRNGLSFIKPTNQMELFKCQRPKH